MTLEQLIAQLNDQIRGSDTRRLDQRQIITDVRSACTASRRDPTPEEAQRVGTAEQGIRSIDAEIATLQRRASELERELAADQAAGRLQSHMHPTGAARAATSHDYRGGAHTQSRDTYNAERDRRGERSFFSDLFNSERGDVGAGTRIREQQAEARANSTSSYAGVVPPSYLVEQAALIARAGRPFASSVQHLDLPEQGMSLIVPRSTTGSSAGVQSTENSGVSLTDEVWTNLTLPVCTVAGQAQVSRQSLERGAPGIDQLVMGDLAGAYAVAVDQQSLSGSGASGQVLGALNTAGFTQATAFTAAVTIATFWSKLAGMISAVTSTRFLPPTHVAMHPRRYAWLCAQVDSQGRPLVLPSMNMPTAAMGEGDPQYGIGPGMIAGLTIVVDANLPTATGTGPEDQVIVYRAPDMMIFEDGDGTPNNLRFEQTLGNQLTTTLVAYGYIGFTAGRYPASFGVIGGNAGTAGFGLVAPTF